MGAVVPQRQGTVLVAGEESVGRQLRLRSPISQEYVSGRLTEFCSDTGLHKFTFQDGREEWVSLANRAYQWMSPVSSRARPNPTFVAFPGNHEAIGWKVRVYWNEMGRWYAGRVRAYDQLTGLHKVMFFDGDVRWYTIRDEAVMWIQKIASVKKTSNGAEWRQNATGTAPEGSETPVQTKNEKTSASKNGKTPRRNTTSTTTTSTSMSSLDSSLSGRPAMMTPSISRSKLPGGMELRPRKHPSLDQLIEKNPHFCLVHARVAIFWSSDNKYYRGTIEEYNEDTEKFRLLYDDNQEEEIELEKEVFRWFGPKANSAGYSALMREVMLVMGAEDVPAKPCAVLPEMHPEDLAELSQPKELVGRKLFLYWHATDKKYEAEVLSYDTRRKLHYLWYRDGELEWVDLKKEIFNWGENTRQVREFPAGLEPGESIPRGKAAVGWRIAVYWRDDVQFYDGRVSKYNAITGRHDVDYDDSQMETLSLSSEKIIWKASPTTGSPHSVDSVASSSQKTPATRKGSRGAPASPKHKRPRLPSPQSTDLAKENNAELLEAPRWDSGDVDTTSAATLTPWKLQSPEKAHDEEEDIEEDLEFYPVTVIPPEPLPPLQHTRVAKLPAQFGASVFQVKIIASKPNTQGKDGNSTEEVAAHVHEYVATAGKMGRMPSVFEFKATAHVMPHGEVAAEYPTKEMTGQETVMSKSGHAMLSRSVPNRGRGRKKGRPTSHKKVELRGGHSASLESVLASFPSVSLAQISPQDGRQSVPPVIAPVIDGKVQQFEMDYSKNLFDAARCGELPSFGGFSAPDAFCLLKDNIGTAADAPLKKSSNGSDNA